MSTVHNVKPVLPSSCEKSILFRHALLLPKTVYSYPSRSSVGRSLPVLAACLVSIGINGATKLFTHLFGDRKNKEVIIETP